MFPPIPTWDALHPLVVHFPIALLLVAPILVVVGMTSQRHAAGLFIAAFLLIVIGTVATDFAVATGEAAAEIAEQMPQASAILESHEELAERTRVIFTVLTVLFAAILSAQLFAKRRFGRRTSLVVNTAFLLLYSAGALILINVAHQGGRLVHGLGVRATATTMPAPERTVSETREKEQKQKDEH